MRKLKAKCSECHTRPRWNRYTRCRVCQHRRLEAAAEKTWRHRKIIEKVAREAREAPPEASRPDGSYPRPDLEKLMDEADAAGAKALRAIARISIPDRRQG